VLLLLPAVGIAAADEVRGDGDRERTRTVVVLMVVIKAAGSAVITVGATAAATAAPTHVAPIIRHKRKTALMRTDHRQVGRVMTHKNKVILHPPIHQILLLLPFLPAFILVPLLLLPSFSILTIIIQPPIFHITLFLILPPSLHHSPPLEKHLFHALLQIGASGGRRGGGIRGERGLRDIRSARLRPNATTTTSRGPSTIPFPILTTAAVAAAGTAAAAVNPNPEGGHGDMAVQRRGKGRKRRTGSSSSSCRSRRRVLHVLVVKREELGCCGGALPGHASNVIDEVRAVPAELRVEVSAGVHAFGDASKAVQVELPLEGGDFVVWGGREGRREGGREGGRGKW